ncbi:MAG: glycosyl hydrolase [Prevotellaceae bacterium]|nr:glycosyl hydrolase [Prevotellaceae bacterium]
MKRFLVCIAALLSLFYCNTEAYGQTKPVCEWLPVTSEMRPGARWWWMGSAVDKKNLEINMAEYASKGMGTLEITPIYGVKNNESREISYLSPQWMDMLGYINGEASRLGMQIDMNNGTGWPFGGPEVSVEDAACKVFFQEYRLDKKHRTLETPVVLNEKKQKDVAKLEKLMAYSGNKKIDLTDKVDANGKLDWKAPKGEWKLIAVFCGKTFQKVKRSAPGGEGYVIDHFSKGAVSRYFDRFTRAFESSGTAYPHSFFNDSYEVYGADYTPGLFDEFSKRRGYKLEDYLPELLDSADTDVKRRLASDYRETFAELLKENFTQQWADWAHSHGSLVRNQAHGSPANLIDLYATVDMPECEGFGLTDFKIQGLRRDSLTRPNFSDLSMLKYASSGAHISGRKYTSSETFTWLTEHFRTSLSQCKPDMDLMFLSGVNHMFFHGTTYSPSDVAWPGWKFYASIDMSPTNNIWRDASAFFDYITRCQSFLQYGQPDNDFLLYLPIYDLWYEQDWTETSRLILFDIHKMAERAPRFIEAVNKIYGSGYDVDYISDSFVRSLGYDGNKLVTSAGIGYKAIVVPGVKMMPLDVVEHLLSLAKQGAKVVFLDNYPEDIPGFAVTDAQRTQFNKVLGELKSMQGSQVFFGHDYVKTLSATGVEPERLMLDYGLKAIRRSNADGFHYFVSALKADSTSAWIPLAVKARSAMLFNPMNGEFGKAKIRNNNGHTEIYLKLASGESTIIKTFTDVDVDVKDWTYWTPQGEEKDMNGKWKISFVSSEPEVKSLPNEVSLGSWTDIEGAQGVKETMGTACYSINIDVTEADIKGCEWLLDLGDVRESARVRVNGKEVAVLFAVPFRCLIGSYLKAGANTIEVEVTNLPANRIADMDRKGVQWRNFKDINIVDLNYKRTPYTSWQPMPSGLIGPVRLLKMKAE